MAEEYIVFNDNETLLYWKITLEYFCQTDMRVEYTWLSKLFASDLSRNKDLPKV